MRCGRAGERRTFPVMNDTRLEIRMPAERRRKLGELANEVGLSAVDLTRLSIRWLLEHRDVLFKLPTAEPR